MIKKIRSIINRQSQNEHIKKNLEYAIRHNDLNTVQEILQHSSLINMNTGFDSEHLHSKSDAYSYIKKIFWGYRNKQHKTSSRSALSLALNIQPNMTIVKALLDAHTNGVRNLDLNKKDGFGDTDFFRIISAKIPIDERRCLIEQLLNSGDVNPHLQPGAQIIKQMVYVSKKNTDIVSLKRLLYFFNNTSTFDLNADIKWRSSSPETLLDWFEHAHYKTREHVEKKILAEIIAMIKQLGGKKYIDTLVAQKNQPAHSKILANKLKKENSNCPGSIRMNYILRSLGKLKLNYFHTKIDMNLEQASNYLHSLSDEAENKTTTIEFVKGIRQITEDCSKANITLGAGLAQVWKEIRDEKT